MNQKPFIIAIIALVAFMMGWNIYIAHRWQRDVNAAYKRGQQQVVDSIEYGLLDATQEDNDSVIVVTYYYDKKVNPNP